MSIGSNIKKLRREHDFTQEQLAELLGLTPSAVSQWETDRVLPDVMQIPQLANIFRVSADVILGIDVETKDARIEEIRNKADNLSCRGYKKEAIVLLEEGLREFPDAYGLMRDLAYNLSFTDSPDKNSRSILLYEKILTGSGDPHEKNTAIGNLCWLYKEAGRIEEARKLAESVEDFTYTHRMCWRSTLNGAEWCEDMRSELDCDFDNYLWKLRNLIDAGKNCRIGERPFFTDEEISELYRKIIVFLDTYYEDGNFGFNHELYAEIRWKQALVSIERNDAESAFGYLEDAKEHILAADEYCEDLIGSSVKWSEEKIPTSILARPMNRDFSDMWTNSPTPENNAAEYLEKLADSLFDPVRTDPRFAEIENTLLKHAKNEK